MRSQEIIRELYRFALTLSVRFEHDVLMRLVAASKQERRTLSDYVRLLVERAEHDRQQS